MRRLAICGHCERTYEVSHLKEAARFHCECGQAVRVKFAKGHDSQVIRCSNCGASREGQEDSCEYCRAEFTLHEKDLNTICPRCFTRVSDRSRYCHSCAVPLAVQKAPMRETSMACPACGPAQKLYHRLLGHRQFPLQECTRCAGVWLGWGTFQSACQEAVRRVPQKFVPLKQAHAPRQQEKGRFYRACPECNVIMNRVHFSNRSGVVIDACVENLHGIWFDLGELPSLLEWIHRGGEWDDRILNQMGAIEKSVAPDPLQEKRPQEVLSDSADDSIYIVDEDVDLDVVLASLFRDEH